jgi:hypothetical protein
MVRADGRKCSEEVGVNYFAGSNKTAETYIFKGTDFPKRLISLSLASYLLQ